MASAEYIKKQEEINERMRDILVEWIIGVHKLFKHKQDTLFFAINYLDRFLELKKVKRDKLQLTGITALFIAAKYEEIHTPDINDYVYVSAKSCSAKDIIVMEILILQTLNYSLTVVTPSVLLKQLSILDNNVRVNVELLAGYFLEISLLECEMLKYAPSVQASAAIYFARKVLKHKPAWTHTLIKYTEYAEEQIKECARDIYKLAQEIELPRFKSIRDKYWKYHSLPLSKISF